MIRHWTDNGPTMSRQREQKKSPARKWERGDLSDSIRRKEQTSLLDVQMIFGRNERCYGCPDAIRRNRQRVILLPQNLRLRRKVRCCRRSQRFRRFQHFPVGQHSAGLAVGQRTSQRKRLGKQP